MSRSAAIPVVAKLVDIGDSIMPSFLDQESIDSLAAIIGKMATAALVREVPQLEEYQPDIEKAITMLVGGLLGDFGNALPLLTRVFGVLSAADGSSLGGNLLGGNLLGGLLGRLVRAD
jgi:hypothetical protein